MFMRHSRSNNVKIPHSVVYFYDDIVAYLLKVRTGARETAVAR
jgi:hypothetical protein